MIYLYTYMLLTEIQHIKRNDNRYNRLMQLCHLSKNMFNASLYIVRQHAIEYDKEVESGFDLTGKKKYLNYYDIWKLMKNDNPDYKALPCHTSQRVIKQVHQAFKSFFALLKLKEKGKYNKKVRWPNYMKKDGHNVVVFDQIGKPSKEDNSICIPTYKDLRFKTNCENVNTISIVPKAGYLEVQFTYEKEEVPMKEDNGNYMSIDLGVSNLASCFCNKEQSFIIDGKPLKHMNQFFNKKYAEEKSRIKTQHNLNQSKQTRHLLIKRFHKIKDYLHKASRYIINQAVSTNINTIVVSQSKGWKQEVNMGEENNQNFVQIPHEMFVDMLIYKGRLEGINVVRQNEAYTSLCSALDNEDVKFHNKYIGTRIYRGLFKATKHFINADINGAINSLRKYLKCNCDAVMPADVGFVYNPIKVSLL